MLARHCTGKGLPPTLPPSLSRCFFFEVLPLNRPDGFFALDRRGGSEAFAYNDRGRRDIARIPPRVQGRRPVETSLSAPPSGPMRQDPSLMAQEHRHSSFSGGEHGRGRDVGGKPGRRSSSRDGGSSTRTRRSMGGKGIRGREKWPSVVEGERPVGRVEESVYEQNTQTPPYYASDPC